MPLICSEAACRHGSASWSSRSNAAQPEATWAAETTPDAANSPGIKATIQPGEALGRPTDQ